MHRNRRSRTATRVILATSLALAALGAVAGKGRTVIPIHDEAGLYAAVARPANAGALLVLDPRTYYLDSRGPLALQADMGLQGVSGDAGAAIIDASGLPAASFVSETGAPTGAIRVGRGSNSVEWLTVQNTGNGASAINTDLTGDDSPRVRVAYVVARAGQRGLDARNLNAPNRRLNLEVVGNQFVDNTAKMGQGLRLVNSGSPGARIQARLSNNVLSGNVAGALVSNLGSSDAGIDVQSENDRFDGNANGCIILGGLAAAGSVAQDNAVSFDARGDSFRGNGRPLPATFPQAGGLLVIAGQVQGANARSAGNTVRVDLHDAEWGDNQGWDLQVWGAQSPGPDIAGTENEATVRLHADAARAWTTERPSDPPEPAGTNTASIAR